MTYYARDIYGGVSNTILVRGKLVLMKVVVCVKDVPDGQSDRRIEDGRIVRGEDDTLNELDENAIEVAVSLVEEAGGQVIALTMGPDGADEAVLRALQMGADRGLHVCDDSLRGADAPETAKVLAATIGYLEQDGPVDLVVLGMASLDGMTSMVPPAVASFLHRPFLGLANSVEATADGLRITRKADGWEDTLEAEFPLVLSVTDQVNEPRYPSFKALKAARSKPLDQVNWAEVAPFADDSVPAPYTAVIDAWPHERSGPRTIIEDTGDGGQRLAEFLFERIK